jgi:putative endonuclease
MKRFFVYILASERNGTVYTGVTSDLVRRVWEHRQKATPGFTERYNIGRLVYFVELATAHEATTREKQIKKWNRAWKLRLIEETNPNWDDLYQGLIS